MKHRFPIRAAAFGLAVCLLTGLCACTGSRGPSDTDTMTAGEEDSFLIDVTPYEEAINTDNSGYLVLVNKEHAVSSAFAPRALTTMDPSLALYGKEIQMEAAAALAAEALIRELWAHGWTDVFITSGYRTYEYQNTLFNKYIADERVSHPAWSAARAEEEVLTYSARPGTSEHQTGLGMDLIIADLHPALDESFASHPCYAWLVENAHRFGFILRFPKGKESVTGYSYEPWHYRFVGREAATAIHEAGLTLEEYLAQTE